MWAISRVGDESRGEEGLVSVVTRQRAPGQVQALRVTRTGDRSVAQNPKVIFLVFCQICTRNKFFASFVTIEWSEPVERPQCVDNYEYRVIGYSVYF